MPLTNRRYNGKNAKIIIFLGFFLLFILVLPATMLRNVPQIVEATAKLGNANLAKLSGTVDSERIIFQLDGEWEYYPNQLLGADDFQKNQTPQYVNFPHYWQDEPENYTDARGFATYRLTGRIAGNFQSFGIYSRFQYGAYKVFLNGEEVLEVGGVSQNRDDYFVSYQTGSAWIGPLTEDTFEIIIQIQNYDHILAGFSGMVYCGDMHQIKFFSQFLMLINGITIGFLLMLLCYFISVYMQNRSRVLYINFAIVTLMSLYVTMTTCNETITYSIVPMVSPSILFRLEYITQMIAALFSTQYIVKKYLKRNIYPVCTTVFSTAVSLLFVFLPIMTISKLRMPFQIIATGLFIVPMCLSLKNIPKDKTRTAFWEFTSLLMLVSGILLSKLGVMLWDCVDMFPILITVYCVIQIVVLLKYYAGIEDDLRKLNQNLESRINERTKELVELNKKAEAATAAKSDFLAQMSHEIRTPMNAIIGMSDLIETDNLNESQKLYFRDIKAVSHSLLNIINDILDFSKIESGKFQIAPVHFNFYSLIDNVCSVFYYSAKSKGLMFESSVDIDIPVVLYGDETRMRQIISNILSNAVKYTQKGTIKFSAGLINDGRDILFTVSDTGVGIKEEDIPRLFKLFEQLDKNDSVKGTGLGLAICKQLTEMMGGTVSVESEYGAGSTFTVSLPIAEGDPSLIETVEIKEKVYAERADVLVVDDNAINITVAKGILATHSIRPDSAESGFEAVRMAERKHYDLIFMDHMMPEMDGVEATAAIRALGGHNRSVPVIALTANAVTGTREFLIENGMTDFISKPIDRVAMNNILAKWLPFDKVETREETKEAPQQDDGLLSCFADIPGLSIEKGLEHIGGSAETYITVLRQFAFETPLYIENLRAALQEPELAHYTVVVHGLKGSLNAIGADWLGDWALSLEKSSKAGERDICEAQTERFCGSILAFIDMLMPNFQDGEERDKQQGTEAQMTELLSKLKTACSMGDCTTIDSIAESLRTLSFGEAYDTAVSKIVSLTEFMEYDKAIEEIDRL